MYVYMSEDGYTWQKYCLKITEVEWIHHVGKEIGPLWCPWIKIFMTSHIGNQPYNSKPTIH